MTTQTEALKLALEALEKLTDAAEGFSVSGVYFNEELWARKCLDDAYDAMGFAQEALAQTEQEPVAWTLTEELERGLTTLHAHLWFTDPKNSSWTPLYTTPPQRTWVGLTDDEMYKLWLTVDEEADRMAFGKAVEAKLKEKNT